MSDNKQDQAPEKKSCLAKVYKPQPTVKNLIAYFSVCSLFIFILRVNLLK